MSRHEDSVRLGHMLDYAREAAASVRGRSRNDLGADRLLGLALVRLLEVVGEAAGRVSEDLCRRHPEVPWPQIAGLRNRLVHGYDSIDMDILWQILQQDIPLLIPELEKIVLLESEN